MKSRVLMAALVVTLLMGVRVYASDCGPCDPAIDPCGSCDSCSRSCDLFSGLKSLVACRPCAASECGPCDGVVACSPYDDSACNPCDDAGCDTSCKKEFTFGKRLKQLFASRSCNPCDQAGDCGLDDGSCNPCDEADNGNCGPCDTTACGERPFTLRKLFKGFKLAGRCNDGCGSPCDQIGSCGDDNGCNPCDEVGPCDQNIGDNGCNPCDEAGSCDPCGASCGQKFGHLFDKPRRDIKKFFDGFSLHHDSGCNPCDAASCNPCDVTCFGSPLPEAGK